MLMGAIAVLRIVAAAPLLLPVETNSPLMLGWWWPQFSVLLHCTDALDALEVTQFEVQPHDL